MNRTLAAGILVSIALFQGNLYAQRAAGRFGVLVAVLFGLVGVLILVSFRLNWHPFAFYYTK